MTRLSDTIGGYPEGVDTEPSLTHTRPSSNLFSAVPETQPSQFGAGFRSGIKTTQALLKAGAATIGDLLGADEFVQDRMNEYDRLMQEAEQFAPDVAKVEDIDSPGKFISWAAWHLGEQVPVIASIFLTGGVAGLVGRVGAKVAIKGASKELLRRRATQWATGGVVAGAAGLETGGIYGEQREAGVEPRPGVALTAGTAAGALEAVTPLALARVFGLGPAFTKNLASKLTEKLSQQGLLKRVGTLGLTIGAGEAATETAQEAIAIAAREFVDENYDTLGGETASRILNAAAGGAIVGGVFGGVGGIRRQPGPAQVVEEEEEGPVAALPPPPVEPELPPDTPPTAEPGIIEKTRLREPVVLFGDQGMEEVDPAAREAAEVARIQALVPPENRTPAQQFLMRDTEQKRGREFRERFQTVRLESTELQRLLDARGNLLNRAELRTEEGTLKPAAKARVDRLSKLIEQRATVEDASIARAPRLSERENQRLSYLDEKERTEGLSEKEYEQLEKLQSKAAGQEVQRVAATPERTAKLDREVAKALKDEGPLYGGIVGALGRGITIEQFAEAIKPVRVAGEGNVQILEHPAQLPTNEVLIAATSAYKGTIQGLYDRNTNTTYFFTANIQDGNRARAIYLHEVIAHHGLGVLPEKVRNDVFRLVQRDRPNHLRRAAEARGIPLNVEEGRLRAAEEVIAELAETGTDISLLDRIIARIRRWLRTIFPDIKITNDEIKLMLRDIGRYLQGRVTPSNRAQLFTPSVYFGGEYEDTPNYTMRVINRLPNKTWITADQVRQAMRAVNANKSEIAVVEDVLNLPHMGRKFMRQTFEDEVRGRIAPLEMHFTKDYADYGLENIGILVEEADFDFEPGQLLTKTTVFTAPFVDFTSSHFSGHDGYVGHTRQFLLYGMPHIIEVQSDLAQTNVVTSAEETAEAIRRHQQHLDNINSVAAEIRRRVEQPIVNDESAKETFTFLDEIRLQLPYDLVGILNSDGHETLSFRQIARRNLLRAESVIGVRQEDIANKIRVLESQLRALQDPNMLTEWDRLKPSIFKRMIREEHRLNARLGFKEMRMASPDTVALVEGWVGRDERGFFDAQLPEPDEILEIQEEGQVSRDLYTSAKPVVPERYRGLYRRYEELAKFVQKEYGAKLVTDDVGHTWYEWNVSPSDFNKPVTAYAGGAAHAATKLAGDNRMPDSLEKYNKLWTIKALTRILTPLQLGRKYALEPIQRYLQHVGLWASTKSDVIAPADKIVERWQTLGKEDSNNLARTLIELSVESDNRKSRISADDPFAQKLLRKLSPKALEMFEEVNVFFSDVLDRLEGGLKYNAARETLESPDLARQFINRWDATADNESARNALIQRTALDPEVSLSLTRRIEEIEKDFQQLRNRNYFPYMRFGPYTVTMKATKDGQVHNNRELKEGQTAAFWTFESKAEQEQWFNSDYVQSLKKQGYDLNMSLMRDNQFAFVGMPTSMLNVITEGLELSEEQRDELKEIFIRHSPGRAFLRHLIRRKGIEGFSQDALRVFASYAINAGNHLARVEHYADLETALADLYGMREDFEARQSDSRGLMEIYNALQRHRYYIMNPENDLAKWRALGFMWYLGFNVKSAAINLTQTPLVTYPYLAQQYSDSAAVGSIAQAIKDAAKVFAGKSNLTEVEDELVARGIKEGFLDESMATELAGISEGSVLQRVLPAQKSHRLINQLSYYGSWPFRQTEKFTRLTAFLAAVRLEQGQGGTTEDMYNAGKDAVQTTLYEYQKWNRPEFMRGKRSVFFLFWTYMQHTAHLAFGGAGAGVAMRMWLMMLLAAGLQGLPFAENILDILDFGREKIKRALGMKDPYSDLRTDLRELVGQITDNPDLVMHGMSRYWGLGPLHALEMAGVPIPHIDVSGSISMGRVLPGIEDLLGPERSVDERFGRTLIDLFGPVFAMPYAMMQTYADNNPDTWKRMERAMPSAMKSVSRASRWMTRGEETFRGGGTVVEFDPHQMEDRVEQLAQMFGFASTRVNQRYELRAAQQKIKEYYMTRRSLLLQDYAYAISIRDPEVIADVNRAIRDYNRNVPAASLRIGRTTLLRSLRERRRRAVQRERGQPTETSFRSVFREIAQAFPEVEEVR